MLNAYRHEIYLGILLKIRIILIRNIYIGFGWNNFDVFRYKVLILLNAKLYTYLKYKNKTKKFKP